MKCLPPAESLLDFFSISERLWHRLRAYIPQTSLAVPASVVCQCMGWQVDSWGYWRWMEVLNFLGTNWLNDNKELQLWMTVKAWTESTHYHSKEVIICSFQNLLITKNIIGLPPIFLTNSLEIQSLHQHQYQ